MIKKYKWTVIGLGALQIFIGIGAVPAGIILIRDPSGAALGVPIASLDTSPFANFLIPGIVLLAVNGIGSLVGGVATLRRHRYAGAMAIALGIFLIAWIVAQVWWMGPPPHWLQTLYFILGIVELALGLRVVNANLREVYLHRKSNDK